MKRDAIIPSYVEFIPVDIEEGVLYISKRFRTASHKCACGCGMIVVTPLKSDKWRLVDKKGQVSMRPSIGNWSFPCKSHYWIRDNSIDWSYRFSPEMIEANRRADAMVTERYLDSRLTIWQRIKRFFMRWL